MSFASASTEEHRASLVPVPAITEILAATTAKESFSQAMNMSRALVVKRLKRNASRRDDAKAPRLPDPPGFGFSLREQKLR
jgi:hypothetical protein